MPAIAMIIDKKDHVATCLSAVKRGGAVQFMLNGRRGKTIKATQPIPYAHKICIKAMKKGDHCLKYGLSIGSATRDIKVGDYIHVHNLESNRGRGDLGKNS